jgi:hypothetical protein
MFEQYFSGFIAAAVAPYLKFHAATSARMKTSEITEFYPGTAIHQ